MMKKEIMHIPHSHLSYGNGVSLSEAKKAFLSGMTKDFKKKVNIKFYDDRYKVR